MPQTTIAFKERGGCAGGGKGYLGSTELAFTLSTNQDQNIMQSYGIHGNVIGRKESNGGNQITGCKEEEAPTLTKTDRHAVMHEIQPIPLNTMNLVERLSGTNGDGIGKPGDPQNTLSKAHHHAVMHEIQPIIIDDQGGSIMSISEEGVVGTLRAQTHAHEPVVVYDTTQVTSPQNGSNPQPGDPRHTISKGGTAPLLVEPVAFCQNQVGDVLTGETMHCLNTNANATGRNSANVLSAQPNVLVRRLTPLECERLQGFPDGYTAIPGASDSKRYAALGNSMTTNVMQWLGQRIQAVEDTLQELSIRDGTLDIAYGRNKNETNWKNKPTLWSVIAGTEISPEQVGLMMACVKISRQLHNPKRDNLVDAAGYIACIDKMSHEG